LHHHDVTLTYEFCEDLDGDGYYGDACGQGDDCGDADPDVNPGAEEICDDDGDDDDDDDDPADCACRQDAAGTSPSAATVFTLLATRILRSRPGSSGRGGSLHFLTSPTPSTNPRPRGTRGGIGPKTP
jgi:hypothetical protein